MKNQKKKKTQKTKGRAIGMSSKWKKTPAKRMKGVSAPHFLYAHP